MTYSEYRSQFKTVEEFKKAFGKLSEEEAHALIAAENAGITVKACMSMAWRNARKEYLERRGAEECKTDIQAI